MLPRPTISSALRRVARPRQVRIAAPSGLSSRPRIGGSVCLVRHEARLFSFTPRASFTSSLSRRKASEPSDASMSDEAVQEAVANVVKTAPVVLFMKGTPETPQCGFSRATVQILGLQGVDPSKFAAFNVLEDNDLRQGIKKYSDWPTIPQLYVDGEFVGGCDILMSMHQDGSLAQLLSEKGVVVEADPAEKA